MLARGEVSPETCFSLPGVSYMLTRKRACVPTAHAPDLHSSLFPTQCIVGVAGGATRAALTMHQARRNNMADVSAKDSSQVSIKHGKPCEVGKGPGPATVYSTERGFGVSLGRR